MVSLALSAMIRPKKLPLYSSISLALVLVLSTSAWADEVHQNIASAEFDVDPAGKPKTFADLVMNLEIPSTFDPNATDSFQVFCFFQAQKLVDDSLPGVRGVKGKWHTQLHLLNHETSTFETVELDKGKFKTTERGQIGFSFTIPTEIFRDEFRSGNVSALSTTTIDLRKGPATTDNTAVCFASTDRQ